MTTSPFAVRGVIEGFYGHPWTHGQRLGLIDFLAVRGMNTFVYSPKDDPMLRERWRAAYDGEDLERLKEIVSELNADWLREKAIPVSQQMLQAHPEINVCVGQNDPMAEACIISAEAQGMDLSKMLFVGYDGLPTPDGGIQSVIDGRLGVTLLYPTGGAEAIDYAVKILEEGLVPEKEVTLGTAVITAENAEEMMAQFTGE